MALSRTVILIRDGETCPPEYTCGPQGPPLTPASREAVGELLARERLLRGITGGEVATSEELCSQQTAKRLGGVVIPNPALNGLKMDMSAEDVAAMLWAGEAPEVLIAHGQDVLANPPEQRYWVVPQWRAASILVAQAQQSGQPAGDVLLPPLAVREIRL